MHAPTSIGGMLVRTGTVTSLNSNIDFHQSVASMGNEGGRNGQGKAARLYVLNTLNNPNGNQQGVPDALPSVRGCGNALEKSGANDTALTNTDNQDSFGVRLIELTTICEDRFADGFEGQDY